MGSSRPNRPNIAGWAFQGSAIALFVAGALYAPAAASHAKAKAPKKSIEYNRDVRPIITKCFTCHGHDPKQVQAGLFLNTSDGAKKRLADGKFAIVPFHPEQSELITRIDAKDEFSIMPPKSSNLQLSVEEKQVLRRWIAEGAEYKEHWGFVRPVRPAAPAVRLASWPNGAIDRFILAKLEEKGLHPSPEADRRTLIRRASLDVTGLPPSVAEVNAFLVDKSKNAYEKVVDRLLASPRYGERMAMDWLDYARYADSDGYQADWERFQWRWRDWVIDAFNHNMPYDEFTVEQIAGDLLPHPTLSQVIATGFNRNHRVNTEGGVVPEEWRVETVIDRVETTAATWLGLTAGCARCHDHKYDPISQREFYSLCAYFNNVAQETGSGEEAPKNIPPVVKAPTPLQQLQLGLAQAHLSVLDGRVKTQLAAHASEAADWKPDAADASNTLATGLVARYCLGDKPSVVAGDASAPTASPAVTHTPGKSSGAVVTNDKAFLDLGNVGDFDTHDKFSYGAWVNPVQGNGSPFSRMDEGHDYRGYDLFMTDGRPAVHLICKWPTDAIKVQSKVAIPNNKWSHIFATYDGSASPSGVHIYINGAAVETTVEQQPLMGSIRTSVTAKVGRRTDGAIFNGQVDDLAIYRRELTPDEVRDLTGSSAAAAILAIAPEKRTAAEREELTRLYLLRTDPAFRKLTDDDRAAAREVEKIDGGITTVMVMAEMPKPRDCFVLIRGQYDHHGDKVTAGIPAVLQIPGKTFAPNRLGLAQWLVDPGNPLTSRVVMNRLWSRLFGAGLVSTIEDFGTRAEYPSHPELLDWLATEFISRKWNLKSMWKEMLMSATYRQSSRITPALLAADPNNRLLARGPRYRLQAEVIRDQAMYVGGLLTERLGGPSVRPYQPAGVWDDLNVYGNLRNYKHDAGPDLHRRSLYTIWKRTAAPPNMTLFDMPSRETCRMERPRTDTPLQALTLLNDETYVEAARALADRMLTEGGSTQAARLDFAFRVVLSRDISPSERQILLAQIDRHLAHYQSHEDAAKRLIAIGDYKDPAGLPAPAIAAYTVVAGMILNLDETINKE